MGRAAILALLVIAAAGKEIAVGQSIQCIPANVCNQPVEFLPTATAYVNAIDGTLGPTVPTSPTQLRVHEQGGAGAYEVELSRTPWSPSANLVLEARVTLTGKGVVPQIIDWTPVAEVPATLLQSSSRRTDLSIEYRLLIRGDEVPGTYSTSLTYALASSDASPIRSPGASGKDAVTTEVTVTIPSYVLLQLDGMATGQDAVLDFDYSGSNISAFIGALQSGIPLAVTHATFDRLQLRTNSPSGYRVDVTVSLDTGPTGSSLSSTDLLLFGRAASGTVLTGTGPTAGPITLVRPADFGLSVDGGVLQGTYSYTVMYSASAGP